MTLQDTSKIPRKHIACFRESIWSYGRGTVTGAQDGWMGGAGRSTEKVRRDLSRIGTPAGHSPAGKETYRVCI